MYLTALMNRLQSTFKFLIELMNPTTLTPDTVAEFKYGVNTDVNIGVSVTRGGNTLFEVMGIC